MPNCKAGELALIVNALSERQHIGKIVRVLRWFDSKMDAWQTDPPLFFEGCGLEIAWYDAHLKPLPGGEGNEDFVVNARKTLPRAKSVTGPVTINARGEPA